MKRTEWTADNAPRAGDHENYLRFLQETSEAERYAILEERMSAKASFAGATHGSHPRKQKN